MPCDSNSPRDAEVSWDSAHASVRAAVRIQLETTVFKKLVPLVSLFLLAGPVLAATTSTSPTTESAKTTKMHKHHAHHHHVKKKSESAAPK